MAKVKQLFAVRISYQTHNAYRDNKSVHVTAETLEDAVQKVKSADFKSVKIWSAQHLGAFLEI